VGKIGIAFDPRLAGANALRWAVSLFASGLSPLQASQDRVVNVGTKSAFDRSRYARWPSVVRLDAFCQARAKIVHKLMRRRCRDRRRSTRLSSLLSASRPVPGPQVARLPPLVLRHVFRFAVAEAPYLIALDAFGPYVPDLVIVERRCKPCLIH